MKLDHKQKPSTVEFVSDGIERLIQQKNAKAVYLVDTFIANTYFKNKKNVIGIEASTRSKDLDHLANIGKQIINLKKPKLIVIGGGILYDIGSFVAASILKEAAWEYYPTTLFSQVDLAITAKNRIKTGRQGAILGTFHPPEKTVIDLSLLQTLNTTDLKSGIGKILKLHAIEDIEQFGHIAEHYERLFSDKVFLKQTIKSGYEIKLKIIKEASDLFNQTYCLNYGENFATAFESASGQEIPPGIALSLGMDLSNYLAYQYGFNDRIYFHRLHPTLYTNYKEFANYKVDPECFMKYLGAGNRNQTGELLLVFPYQEKGFCQHYIPNDAILTYFCRKYIDEERKL